MREGNKKIKTSKSMLRSIAGPYGARLPSGKHSACEQVLGQFCVPDECPTNEKDTNHQPRWNHFNDPDDPDHDLFNEFKKFDGEAVQRRAQRGQPPDSKAENGEAQSDSWAQAADSCWNGGKFFGLQFHASSHVCCRKTQGYTESLESETAREARLHGYVMRTEAAERAAADHRDRWSDLDEADLGLLDESDLHGADFDLLGEAQSDASPAIKVTTVVYDKPEGIMNGCHLDSDWVVARINPDGLWAKHNKAKPADAIKVGDRIMSVNGETDSNKFFGLLRGTGVMTIRFESATFEEGLAARIEDMKRRGAEEDLAALYEDLQRAQFGSRRDSRTFPRCCWNHECTARFVDSTIRGVLE